MVELWVIAAGQANVKSDHHSCLYNLLSSSEFLNTFEFMLYINFILYFFVCFFQNKVVTVDNVKVKLQIWDTAGQERFRSVTHAYYRDAHALLLLYDITSKSSFDNIRAWLTEIHEYAQSDVVIMLLGNKADMSSDRAIRRDEGERLAREYSVPFMETSAKTGVNVDLAFTAVAKYDTDFIMAS
uniref:RAB37, member RAS oncogene family n=1 Tax=Sphaeramia orbicularis TaxID=375764 RepID=A0A673AK37_9TELE